MRTAWLIGSRPHVPATALQVTANAVSEAVVVPAGNYYLWDADASQSLINAVATAIASHSEIATCTGGIRESRVVAFTANVAFEITSWGAGDNIVRDMLGFAGTTGSAATQPADGISPYLWSPRKPESPASRLGTTGQLVKDTAVGQAGTTIVSATEHNAYHTNRFRWNNVLVDRMQTTTPLEGGTYEAFWDAVLSRMYRFRLYRDITEGTGTTLVTPLTDVLPTESTHAYFMRPPSTMRFPYSRSIEYQERYCNVDLNVITRRDY